MSDSDLNKPREKFASRSKKFTKKNSLGRKNFDSDDMKKQSSTNLYSNDNNDIGLHGQNLYGVHEGGENLYTESAYNPGTDKNSVASKFVIKKNADGYNLKQQSIKLSSSVSTQIDCSANLKTPLGLNSSKSGKISGNHSEQKRNSLIKNAAMGPNVFKRPYTTSKGNTIQNKGDLCELVNIKKVLFFI